MNNTSVPSQRVDDPMGHIDCLRSPVTGFAHTNWDESDELANLAHQMLEDPVALEQLCDRVFELLKRDIHLQRERSWGYRRG